MHDSTCTTALGPPSLGDALCPVAHAMALALETIAKADRTKEVGKVVNVDVTSIVYLSNK